MNSINQVKELLKWLRNVMKESLIDKNLDVGSYDEYIDKIVDVFRLSSKKSSILFDVKINNYQASILLSILNQSGSRERFRNVILNCDYSFYHEFLLNLVQRVYQSGNISTTDIVRLSGSDLVTFRMITANNDLFSIDGLSSDDAKNLLNICNNTTDNKSLLKEINRRGIGSFYIFIFVVLVVVLLFLVLILFLR